VAIRFISVRANLVALCMGLFVHAAWAIDPIKIGATVAQSPPGASSQQVRDGLEIALKIINDAGGALGRPFELVFKDTSPDNAGATVETLITQDKVTAIVGEHHSASALAGLEVAHRYKIPYITGARSRAIGEKLYPEFFNPGMSNLQIAAAIAEAMKALGAKRVVAFTENSDTGIEFANLLAHQLNRQEVGIQYAFEPLDPAAKDFASVLEPHKGNPPDAIVQIVRPPAAYVLVDQLHQQGIAPTAKTWLYEASSLIEDPAFWQNAKADVRGMLVFGQYHPKMTLPDLGRKVADAYTAKTKKEAGGMVLQAADSLLMVAEAIRSGGSSEPEAITKALETLKWTGTRGKITFSAEKEDDKYHQWLDVPFVTFQITAAKQPLGETNLVQDPGQALDLARVQKPGARSN
jgi:branched-chain amino acid transport system substrate-binding protein